MSSEMFATMTEFVGDFKRLSLPHDEKDVKKFVRDWACVVSMFAHKNVLDLNLTVAFSHAKDAVDLFERLYGKIMDLDDPM